MVGALPCISFSTMRKIRGMEFFLADVLLYEEEVKKLAVKVRDLTISIIKSYADAGADEWAQWARDIFICEGNI